MFGLPFDYNEPLFRPPSEAYSLIFQVTLGCSWNKCAFCEMYSSKKFKTRKFEDVKSEIENTAKEYNDIRKVFLADGNAMVLSSAKLIEILTELNRNFPKLNRVSAYALPNDISSKTKEELIELKNAGLKLLYVGIESGDDEVLKMITKGETYNSTLDGLLKAREAGIKLSVMILNGLGGKKYSEQHAINSAKLVNEIKPEFLSTLVLSYPYGEDHFIKKFNGDFIKMTKMDLIKEMKTLIEKTELENTVFRSDHASNYLVLKGNLSRDKNEMLNRINQVLENPEYSGLREEWQRGL
ncbi:MAG: radical SAM protein [Bacteroidales bacterium]|nr:radical SAM protein [Bacteroidales bacterium]